MDKIKSHLIENELQPNILINGLGGGFGSKTFDSVDVYQKVMHLNFFVSHMLMDLIVENAKRIGWGRIIHIGTLAIT